MRLFVPPDEAKFRTEMGVRTYAKKILQSGGYFYIKYKSHRLTSCHVKMMCSEAASPTSSSGGDTSC